MYQNKRIYKDFEDHLDGNAEIISAEHINVLHTIIENNQKEIIKLKNQTFVDKAMLKLNNVDDVNSLFLNEQCDSSGYDMSIATSVVYDETFNCIKVPEEFEVGVVYSKSLLEDDLKTLEIDNFYLLSDHYIPQGSSIEYYIIDHLNGIYPIEANKFSDGLKVPDKTKNAKVKAVLTKNPAGESPEIYNIGILFQNDNIEQFFDVPDLEKNNDEDQEDTDSGLILRVNEVETEVRNARDEEATLNDRLNKMDLKIGEGSPTEPGITEIPQATATELGGIKAKAKTNETVEIAIDSETGKLYAPESEIPVGSGLPSGGTTGQILAKADNEDHNTQWVDRIEPDVIGAINTIENIAMNASYIGEEVVVGSVNVEDIRSEVNNIKTQLENLPTTGGGAGLDFYCLFDPGDLASSRDERGVTDYFQVLTPFKVVGGYFYTDWRNGYTFTFKIWDENKNLLTSASIIGDGAINSWKLIPLAAPYQLNHMAHYFSSIEVSTGSMKKYYGDPRANLWTIKKQPYSGLPDGTLTPSTSSYSTGLKIQA